LLSKTSGLEGATRRFFSESALLDIRFLDCSAKQLKFNRQAYAEQTGTGIFMAKGAFFTTKQKHETPYLSKDYYILPRVVYTQKLAFSSESL
jgi:hypothetical protein